MYGYTCFTYRPLQYSLLVIMYVLYCLAVSRKVLKVIGMWKMLNHGFERMFNHECETVASSL